MGAIDRPRQKVKRAAQNRGLQLMERLGYVVRGMLYVVMGFLALGVAVGKGGKATDLDGSLLVLIRNPFGTEGLIVAIAGLAAYSVWGLVRAIYDPLRRGDDAAGYVERLGFLSSAFSYAAVVLFAVSLLAGAEPGNRDSLQRTIGPIMAQPFGGVVTVLIGVLSIGVGVGQFVEAYRAIFRRDLKRSDASKAERDITVALGRFGMGARGVTFLVMGSLLVDAGVHHDPGKAKGYGGVFMVLLQQPFGHVVLAIVALGFVALGLHSFACARWVRLMGSSD
jgi:hypothetical protein